MNCKYRNCQTDIGDAPTFRLCEVCRVLDNADRLRLVMDPTAKFRPVMAQQMVEVMITQMTGEEMLRFQSNAEFVYLEVCKAARLYSPAPTNKRVKMTLQEQIDEARSSVESNSIREKQIRSAVKRTSTKRLSVLQKQMNALGCSETCREANANCEHMKNAKRIFDSDFGEL